MTTKAKRKIVQIDAAKCNGCGACIDRCAEGALALVDGKAKLVSDVYCDGLAACLGTCPQDAIRIIERNAQAFDEEAAKEHVEAKPQPVKKAQFSCPGSAVRQFATAAPAAEAGQSVTQRSMLPHWPVQLALVPPRARFLAGTDVVLVADCVPFAYPNLHRDFLKDHSVLVACPKLDDADAHLEKLTDILRSSDIKSLTVVHMEVPCCSGLANIARKAIAASDKDIPYKEITIGIKGEIQAETVGV